MMDWTTTTTGPGGDFATTTPHPTPRIRQRKNAQTEFADPPIVLQEPKRRRRRLREEGIDKDNVISYCGPEAKRERLAMAVEAAVAEAEAAADTGLQTNWNFDMTVLDVRYSSNRTLVLSSKLNWVS